MTSPKIRNAVSKVIAKGIKSLQPETEPNGIPPSAELTRHKELLTKLTTHGYALLGQVLSPQALREIHAFLQEKAVITAKGAFRTSEVPLGTRVGDYPLATLLECPHILNLANQPDILRIMSDYLGCKPTISQLGMRWSYCSPGSAEYVQQYHRDYDDWRFIKLFVYLTDVDETSGPHTFIAGSHLTRGRLRASVYTPDDIERENGADSVRAMTGQSGMGFLVNTYGIHKGEIPISRQRLLLQIQYSVLPVYMFRYHPVSMRNLQGFDMYVNRLLIRC